MLDSIARCYIDIMSLSQLSQKSLHYRPSRPDLSSFYFHRLNFSCIALSALNQRKLFAGNQGIRTLHTTHYWDNHSEYPHRWNTSSAHILENRNQSKICLNVAIFASFKVHTSQMFFLYKPVQLVQSKKVLLKDRKFGQVFEENVIQEKGPHSNTADLYFINKKNKYIWDESIQMFRKLRNVDETLNQSDFYKMHGLSPNEVKERMKTFGTNIIKISVPPVLHLIIHEVFCKQSFYC